MLSPDDTKELISRVLWLKIEKNENNITLVKNIYFFFVSGSSISDFRLHGMLRFIRLAIW